MYCAIERATNHFFIVDYLRTRGITSVRAIAAELNERALLTPPRGAPPAPRLLSRLQA
jgi:hypothetical protein